MTPQEVIARLDLGTLERIEDLPRVLREHRAANLRALQGSNPGLSLPIFQRIAETRRAEIRIAEEALRNLGERFEDEPC